MTETVPPPVRPRIPYGEASFRRIRVNGWLYVDKTRFLRPLEEERYAFLIRPRRFGKSCWVSLLENYYDRHWRHEFDQVFAGTDIGANPTDERHGYVTLRFNFSAFNDDPATLEHHFEEYCALRIRAALRRHADLFPEQAVRDILGPDSVNAKLNELFDYAVEHDIRLYVLVDEYDNFANTMLAHHGSAAYERFTHGGGFYRNFFATLKAGAGSEGGGIERLFITGVSPVTLDDVTSGFNIGTNVSLLPEFNEMLGFTEAEVRGLVAMYRERGLFDQDVDEALGVMSEWYNGYRFANEARSDVYNTDMVLYYLKASMPNKRVPEDLIDTNVRIDYGKLRHLLTIGRQQLNGNFDQLRHLIAQGRASVRLQKSFPLDELDRPDNFLSLLHYFGLLSIRETADGRAWLAIPNLTVRQLMYGYLRDGFRDVGLFSVSRHAYTELMRRMAYDGDWRPALEYLRDAVEAQTGIHDYLGGEKVIQGFLAAHFGMADEFLLHSEHELGKGYADLYLEPFTARLPSVGYGYVIELKYLKRGQGPVDGRVTAAVKEAKAQLGRYLADEQLVQRHRNVRLIGLAAVFHGWEMVACESVEATPRDD